MGLLNNILPCTFINHLNTDQAAEVLFFPDKHTPR
jgi:hypothetical protein